MTGYFGVGTYGPEEGHGAIGDNVVVLCALVVAQSTRKFSRHQIVLHYEHFEISRSTRLDSASQQAQVLTHSCA